jgi:hypothetical protein
MLNEPMLHDEPNSKERVNLRFGAAMAVYAILAILAGFTLTGNIRLATWIFLGGIALKTYLVVLKHRAD